MDNVVCDGAGFVENRGQLDDDEVLYYSRTSTGGIQFIEQGVIITVVERGHNTVPPVMCSEPSQRTSWTPDAEGFGKPAGVCNVWFTFEGSKEVMPVGREPLGTHHNYLVGNDSASWRTNVHLFESVTYEGLYEGIDLTYRYIDGRYKYEFLVHPSGEPNSIRMMVAGHDGLRLASDGSLEILSSAGIIQDRCLDVYYQDDPGNRILASFQLLGDDCYGFDIAQYDDARTLVIDPLVYSTYLGGTDYETERGFCVDDQGQVYIAGQTMSDDFPITPGAIQKQFIAQQFKAFVTVMDANGTRPLYSTYLGGSKNDGAYDIRVGTDGTLYVTGWTDSQDFPVTDGAFQPFQGGDGDAFVSRLSSAGDRLLYSTCIGGEAFDCGTGIELDTQGGAYVVGWTESIWFPTCPSNVLQDCLGGLWDAFVCKVDPHGASLNYSTYLGGAGYELGNDIAIDDGGCAYLTGYTGGDDFPTTDQAFQPDIAGTQYDAFVSKIERNGTSLVYSSYLGGKDREGGQAIALDGEGCAYIAGFTLSTDFPVTPGAIQGVQAGSDDGFVCSIDENGTSLVYSTYLGGKYSDRCLGVTTDEGGTAYVTGKTTSTTLPTTRDAVQRNSAGSTEAFVTAFDPTGAALLYSTYFGGSRSDWGTGIELGPDGMLFLLGGTTSTDLETTTGAYQSTFTGAYDSFIAKIEIDFERPRADAGPDLIVEQHTKVAFNASASWDNVGIVRWRWTFGYDGQDIDLRGSIADFTFHVVGAYTIVLNVSDAAGLWDTDEMNVTVLDSTPPFAAAGSDVFIDEHETVIFNGSGSMDNVGIENWTWTFKYNGTVVILEGPVTSFTFDEPGRYRVLMNVSDLRGNWAMDEITVTVRDITNPVAEAGPDIGVDQHQTVEFNGSGSTDNVGVINWTWTFTFGGQNVTLYGPTPTYVFHVVTDVVVFLRVEDAERNWATDALNVTVRDVTPPRAYAGPDQAVDQHQEVLLDGSWSSDNVAVSSFTWTVVDADGNVTLDGQSPTHVFEQAGTFVVVLTVTDNAGNWAMDEMVVTVRDVTDPVAYAGPDRTMDPGETISLDGTGSRDNVGITNYTWTLELEDETIRLYGPTPALTLHVVGTYSVSLLVHDERNNFGMDNLTVRVLDITDPVANAGTDIEAMVGELVPFDGTASTDDVGVVNWSWSFEHNGTRISRFGAAFEFAFEVPGNYTVILEVMDGAGNVGSDDLVVTVKSPVGPEPEPIPGSEDDHPPLRRWTSLLLLAVTVALAALASVWYVRSRMGRS